MASLFSLLIALHVLPFLPGVQARERQPAEPPAPLRKRAASDGQYENQSPEATSPRSPGVRSPVQCVSPELALTIALNPGGRPKEVSPGVDESWGHSRKQSPWCISRSLRISCSCFISKCSHFSLPASSPKVSSLQQRLRPSYLL